MSKVTDIIVETNNPRALDGIVNQFGAAVIQDNLDIPTYRLYEGGYVVRCFADPGFIEFMITNQGYGKVLKRLPELI